MNNVSVWFTHSKFSMKGNLRWRAPRSPPASSEIQNATAYGIQCIQGSIDGNAGTALSSPYRDASGQFLGSQETDNGMFISDEDCLFLEYETY